MSHGESPAILDNIINPTIDDNSDEIYQEDEDYKAYGTYNMRGEPMIDFIDLKGNHQALPYIEMYHLGWDRSDSILCKFQRQWRDH